MKFPSFRRVALLPSALIHSAQLPGVLLKPSPSLSSERARLPMSWTLTFEAFQGLPYLSLPSAADPAPAQGSLCVPGSEPHAVPALPAVCTLPSPARRTALSSVYLVLIPRGALPTPSSWQDGQDRARFCCGSPGPSTVVEGA